MTLKPRIKRMLRQIKGFWHNRQLVKNKELLPMGDYVEAGYANDSKIILMGIDALTWRVLDPLLDNGKLPHLRSIIARGSYGPLKTLCPALSPELWNTISTGKLPKKHGIMGFMATDPKTKKLVPYTSNMRRCKAIWEILGGHNKKVGVVGWWNSWPAERVNGSLVCGILGYKIKDIAKVKNRDGFVELSRKSRLRSSSFRQQTYPESLFDEIKHIIRPPGRFQDSHDFIRRIWKIESSLGRVERESLRLITNIYNTDRTYKDIARYIWTKSRPDFLTVYIAGLDVAGHKYWAYMEPELFSTPPSGSKTKLYGSLIHDYYGYVDEIVGEFLELVDSETTIAVVSDHGMSPDDRLFRRTGVNSARHFDEDGVFMFAGPHIRPHHLVKGRFSVLDIAPTLLSLVGLPVAADMDGSPIEEAFTQEFRSQNPLRFIRTYDIGRDYDDRPIESPVDDTIKKHLQSLGYID
jgi:predicted AlkP superfamily phosphohydrolase/phosphomutase